MFGFWHTKLHGVTLLVILSEKCCARMLLNAQTAKAVTRNVAMLVRSYSTKRVTSDNLTQHWQQLRVAILCAQHQRKLWEEITEKREICSCFAQVVFFHLCNYVTPWNETYLMIIWYQRTSISIYIALIPVQNALHLLHAQFSLLSPPSVFLLSPEHHTTSFVCRHKK